MYDNDLIKKLNILKQVQPDAEWKNSNRELLFSQIFSGEKIEASSAKFSMRTFLDYLDVYFVGNLSKVLARPTLTVMLVLIIAFGSGFFGLRFTQDTKPGDSLYIAKIISEKTQLALTFGEKNKAQLEISFASNRTKELTQIVSENNEGSNERVEQLTEDFKREINSTKQRLQKIAQRDEPVNPENNQAADASSSKLAVPGKDAKNTGKDTEVFSANTNKDKDGIEISAPATQQKGSTTKDTGGQVSLGNEPSKILEEAEKLFDSKDYEGTINKLEEANTVLDQSSAAGANKEPDFIKTNTDATTTK